MKVDVKRVKVADLKLLERNARFMRHETFQTLVSNIRDDGALTQLPFCCPGEDGGLVVAPGNHRVMAAKEAGLEEILVLYTEDVLPHDKQLQIQLSHNAIVGEDDPLMLKQLYSEIADIEMKLRSGLSDKALDLLPGDIKAESISEPNLDLQTISITFLPQELEALRGAIESAKSLIGGEMWAAMRSDYDRFMDALTEIQQATGVTNVATAMMVMLEVYERHRTDLAREWMDEAGAPTHKGWIPISSIFGRTTVPSDLAAKLKQAVDAEVACGTIDTDKRWQILGGICGK